MNILHVAHSIKKAYGGPTESLKAFAKAARLHGARVTVAAPEGASEDAEAILEAGGDSSLVQFRSFGTGAFTSSPSLIRWVDRNASRFDVVHIHGLFNSISSLSARRAAARGVPTVLRPFGTLSRYTLAHRRTTLKRLWFSMLDRRNVSLASALHFTTDAERDEALLHRIAFGSRAFVIPPPLLGPVPESPRRLASADPQVLFLSRLDPVKNLEVLIDAWATIEHSIPGARLRIVGAGEPSYVRSLQHRARLVNAASVSFEGFLTGSAKADAFSQATVFALPSRHESFGLAVLEALAAGVPVVVSPEVQLAPFIKQHSLGMVTTTDAESFATAIVAAIADTRLRERVAAVGSRLVREYFGAEAIGSRLIGMYAFAMRAPLQAEPHHNTIET